jgi:hypothetical protein
MPHNGSYGNRRPDPPGPVRVWNHLSVDALIARYVPPYGLAPGKWREQAAEIRALPETRRPDDERRAA